MSPTVEQLLVVAEQDLLINAGVNNWEWYGESLHSYKVSEDPFEDAERFISAMETGGVDNWDGYSDALEGYSDYREYLEELTNVNDALDIYQWFNTQKEPTPVVVVDDVTPVVERRAPKGAAEQELYEIVSAKFGADRADDVFERIIEAGFWKSNNFAKEFKSAIKLIVKGVENPLEVARGGLLAAIIKNGKLDAFLSDFNDVKS